MKYIIFPGEEPVPILDRSYVTNIQILCPTMEEVLILIGEYVDKDWGSFAISRGGNITEYTGYILETAIIDLIGGIVVHFILSQPAGSAGDPETEQYAEAGRILLGETS